MAALAGDVEGLRERGAQAAGGDRGQRLVVDADAEHGELVAAEPGDEVLLAHGARRRCGDLDQQPVAGLVAEAVVDDLEVVEVEEEHGDALARLGGSLERRDERGAVRQAGEGVEPGAAWKTSADKTSLSDRPRLAGPERLVRLFTRVERFRDTS